MAAVHLSEWGIPTISIWHARTPLSPFKEFRKSIRSSRQQGQWGWLGLIQSSTIPESSISTPFRMVGSTIGFPWGSILFLSALATARWMGPVLSLMLCPGGNREIGLTVASCTTNESMVADHHRELDIPSHPNTLSNYLQSLLPHLCR